jgi:lipopolysaccharide/colanic/teichoic acid biosynthesis glycosyltransferase
MKFRFNALVEALRSGLHSRVGCIHSRDVFQAILKHERAVAERNGERVTVLAFRPAAGGISAAAVRVLGRILDDRLRASDIAGWLDSRTIGVLLPNAECSHAVQVAEQIRGKLVASGIPLEYAFYGDGEDGNGNGDDRDRRDPAAPSAGATPARGVPAGPPVTASGAYAMADLCLHPLPAWKRSLDILLCLMILLVFWPLMLLIAAGIRVVSPGPVLFRQERIGFRGKPFMLYKFRSMRLDSDTAVHQAHLARLMTSDATLVKLDSADRRLLPYGRIFRATGLDELPQLFNILRGDMSFIGPRPCVPYEYAQFNPWQRRRCDAYPGLTGLWQVSGKNHTTFTEMMRMDIRYGRRPSLWRDLGILLRTVPALVRQVRETRADGRGR